MSSYEFVWVRIRMREGDTENKRQAGCRGVARESEVALMPEGAHSVFGETLIVASAIGTAGIGLVAVVALAVVLWRRKGRPIVPPASSLPHGWRVIAGGQLPHRQSYQPREQATKPD